MEINTWQLITALPALFFAWGFVISLYFANKHIQGFMSGAFDFRTMVVPQSGAWVLIFAAALFLYFIQPENWLSPFGYFLWGFLVMGISIMFPHFFLKKGQYAWASIPVWVRIVSQHILFPLSLVLCAQTISGLLLPSLSTQISLVILGLLGVLLGVYVWNRDKKYFALTELEPQKGYPTLGEAFTFKANVDMVLIVLALAFLTGLVLLRSFGFV